MGKGKGVESNCLGHHDAARVASGSQPCLLVLSRPPPSHHAAQGRGPEIEDESGSGEDGGSEDGVGDESRTDASESESDTSEDEGDLPGVADDSAARKRDLRPRPRTAAAPHGAGSGAGGDEGEVDEKVVQPLRQTRRNPVRSSRRRQGAILSLDPSDSEEDDGSLHDAGAPGGLHG